MSIKMVYDNDGKDIIKLMMKSMIIKIITLTNCLPYKQDMRILMQQRLIFSGLHPPFLIYPSFPGLFVEIGFSADHEPFSKQQIHIKSQPKIQLDLQ